MSKRKESRERKMKKLFAMLFAMIFVVTSRPLTANAATKVIVKTDCKLGAGKSVTKTVPAKISSAKSSKTSVATVKKVSSKTFKITGKKAGSATITVKYKKTTMKISVKVGATSVKNSTIPTSMEVGDMGLYKVSAKNATGDKFTWKSSNSEVIQVGSFSGTANTITALKAGTASVKVTSKNSGKQVTVKINVVETNSGAVPTVTKSPTTEPEVTAPVQMENGSIPDDALQYNGHCYYLYTTDSDITWTQAKDTCEKLGGHLVTIGDALEQAVLEEYLPEDGTNMFYIGATVKDGMWQWITNEKMEYTNILDEDWLGETTNISYASDHGTRMVYAPQYGWNWTWGGYTKASDANGYICEWDYQIAIDESQHLVETSTPKVTTTVKPTATTAGSILTATPKATATPTATPIPTVEPTEKVTATPKVTSTVKPTATPKVTATPTVTPIPESNGPFAGGEGTADSPYLVSTLEQLQKVSEYKDCYFKQISDIDVDYGAFEPLSTEKEPFTGEYDGGECSILNYNYADGDAGMISIFGWIGKEGVIKNVTVKDSFLTAKSGAVLVYSNDGNILNCNVENTSIRLAGKSTALICAYNGGTMRNCISEGTIVYVYSINDYHFSIGGVVGNNEGNIYNCSSICDIKATSGWRMVYVGGIAGFNAGMVKDCESGCVIDANASVSNVYSGFCPYAGGVVGLNDGQVIQCTYSKTIDDITVNRGENKGLITGGGEGIVN